MWTKSLLFTTVLALTGCAHHSTSPPLNVAMVPNDCANRELIVNWLSSQAAVPKQTLETEQEYERNRSAIRAKIWVMRYHCQPV